jgi:hypothetical protein
LLVASCLAIIPAVATAGTTTLYVDASASASSPCTPAPCHSIQDAVDAAEAYSGVPVLIEVAANSYSDAVTIPEFDKDTNAFLSSFANLTIQGASSSSTILNDQQPGNGVSTGSDVTIDNTGTGTVSINGLTISGGVKVGYGGGVDVESGTVVLNDDAIVGNSATGICGDGGSYGGGIYNDGVLTLNSDTIAGNTAQCGGGIGDDAGITLNNDTIAKNTAYDEGGGIYDDFGNVTLLSTTFVGNSAPANEGGGLYNYQGSGGGVITIADSLLAANPGGSCSGPVSDNGYNVSDDGTCSFGSESIQLSPTIGPLSLAANGSTGPQTEAMTDTSSAFNEVPQSACTLNVDERGLPRPGDGPKCDAGAFELQATAPPPTSTTTTSTTTVTNGRRPPPLTTGAVISLNPPLGPPGQVTTLTGSGFQNGANVTLTWDPDIGATPVHLVATGGKLNQSVVIFAHDQLGPTILVASVNGAAQASTKYLVVPNSMEPSGPTDGLFRP